MQRVNQAMSDFKMNSQSTSTNAEQKEASDIVSALMPPLISALATAVSVAVGEILNKALHHIDENTKQMKSDPRLLANMRTLTYENDRLHQYSRRENVRIFGIPVDPSEPADVTEKKTLAILNETGADVRQSDISACHRLGKTTNGSRPVIVRFVSRKKRTEILQKKKSLRSAANPSHHKVFINDDLTPLRSKLFKYVKDLPSTEKVWTIDGKIFCTKRYPPGARVPDQLRPFVVESPDDLFKLGEDSVDYARLGLHHLDEHISDA